jgi:hypothetical protein
MVTKLTGHKKISELHVVSKYQTIVAPLVSEYANIEFNG